MALKADLGSWWGSPHSPPWVINCEIRLSYNSENGYLPISIGDKKGREPRRPLFPATVVGGLEAGAG